jgi:adenylate cyclase
MAKKSYLSRLNETRVGLLMVAVVFVIFFSDFKILNELALKFTDFNFKLRGQVSGKRDVVVVAIDQKSQDKFGRWPWTRTVLAGVIDNISKHNPRVIGTDIVFSYPEERPDLKLAKKLLAKAPKTGEWRKNLENAEKEADADGRLADAIRRAGNVVPGYFFITQDEEVSSLKADSEETLNIIRSSRFPSFKKPAKEGKRKFALREAADAKPNIPSITEASKFTGYFNMFPDEDGVLRATTNVIEFKGKYFPSLSLQLLRGWYGDNKMKLEFEEYGVKGVSLGGGFIPTDEYGRTPINFYGDEKAFPTISAAELADGGMSDEKLDPILRGKIVIIAATAMGIYDLRTTPFGIMPGVYLHASFIQNVLDGIVLKRAGWFLLFDALSIIILGVILILAMKKLKVVGGAALALALIFGYVWFQRYMFVYKHTILDVLYPIMTVVFVYGGLALHKYLTEASEKKYVKTAFAHYLSPKVVNKILEDPGKLQLGGDMKELTASFSDVKDFSGISEKLTPHELVELLNEYLTEMTDVILGKDGTLDKYIGDAIVSFFGAPLEYQDHAFRACRATILCRKRLDELQVKWAAAGRPPLEARFGLNTGKMLVGNMGSTQRFDYTIMGDEVNLASRLESINKQYGTYICVSESTWRAAGGARQSSDTDLDEATLPIEIDTDANGKVLKAKDKIQFTGSSRNKNPGFEWRELDVIRVVGRKAPVRIFELLDFKGGLSKEKEGWLLTYNEGYALYTARKFERAAEVFKVAAGMNGKDIASLKMAARCEGFLKIPPADDWDGVFTHTTK